MNSPLRARIAALPVSSGVYLMKDGAGAIIYVGKAVNLRRRVQSYFRGKAQDPKTGLLVAQIADIDVVQTHSEAAALILEAALVKEHFPRFNIDLKDGKSYPYIELTQEEFPLVSLVRLAGVDGKKPGARYFGPYVDAPLVREALGLVRKIFPFRSCLTMPKKPCLYNDIGLCDAPCAGQISVEDYRRKINNIRCVLDGRKDELYRNLRQDMERLAQARDFERAAEARDQLRAVGALYASSPDANYFKEAEQLQRAFGLPRRPERVECIDISTTMGANSVGSVVTFLDGRPDKSNYRRFRIREVEGMDDFKMVAEVVRRRYGRLKRAGAAYPDLVIIDGGKGQLAAAEAELRALDAAIPLISLAKREEEVFLPGRRGPVILDRSSLALRFLQRVRDEALRFALAYHRILRGKKFVELERNTK